MRDNKYNGWSNRNTYLFHLHFADHIHTMEDYEHYKNVTIANQEAVSEFLSEQVHVFFCDVLQIADINWNELEEAYKQEIQLQKLNSIN